MTHTQQKNDLPFELRLVLDRADRSYTPGAPITGTIEVRVLKACQCRALRLRLVWETHGRGASQRGMLAPIQLFAGEWGFDRLLRYPFRLEAPFASPSYDGKYLSLHWYLRAQVDVSRALGTRRYGVEERLTLLPDAEEPLGTEGSWWCLLKLPAAPGNSAADIVVDWCSYAFRVVGLGVVLGALATSWLLVPEEGLCTAISLFIIILLFAGFFLPALFLFLAPFGLPILSFVSWLSGVWKPVKVSSPEAGAMALWLDQHEVAPGGTLPLRLRLQAGSAVRILQLDVMVQAHEVVGGTRLFRSSCHHLVFCQKALSCLDQKLENHEVLELALVKVPLPEDAPASFTMGASAVRWSVSVQLRLETPGVVDENGSPEKLEHTREVPFRVLQTARATHGDV